MSTTYTKPLKSIVIYTIGGGEFTVSDSASSPMASSALAEFNAHDIMHFEANDAQVLVPFHAVDHIIVSVASSGEITRDDPVCAE